MHYLFLLIWVLVLPPADQVSSDSTAQSPSSQGALSPLSFERTIKELSTDPALDYQEQPEKDNAWTRFKKNLALQWKRVLDRLFGGEKASGFLLWLLESLPYLILLSVLGLLVFLFTKLDPGGSFLSRSTRAGERFSKEEDIVRYEDIPALIQEAVSRNDYRLAVRYHFLYILQQLSRKHVIRYDKTKTDADYATEISDATLKKGFEKANQIYDFIWYGYFETDEVSYHKVTHHFRNLETLIEDTNE